MSIANDQAKFGKAEWLVKDLGDRYEFLMIVPYDDDMRCGPITIPKAKYDLLRAQGMERAFWRSLWLDAFEALSPTLDALLERDK